MKILLMGGSGQVGAQLQRTLAPLGELVVPARAACDLENAAQLRACVRAAAPDVIVNAAAYTAVDQAETERTRAWAVNAAAPRILGEEAARLGALVLHFSTDYVFNGEQATPYTERALPDPRNVYGASKYAGELALAAANPQHLILRTSWVLGQHGNNFAKTMLRLASERASFGVVADQFGAPTSAALLAEVSAQLLRRYQHRQPMASGLYHVTAAGSTSWYDYARCVLAQALAAGVPLQACPETLQALASADYPGAAQRPHNSRLDCTRLSSCFDISLPPWQVGVQQVVQDILETQAWRR